MNYLKDHKVEFRSETTIAQFAKDHRSDAVQRDTKSYVIAAIYILRNMIGIFQKNGVTLKLNTYEYSPSENRPAYVEFSSFTLHVEKGIWLKALDGQPYENFILAHELGHIVLHDNYAPAFLVDQTKQLGQVVQEQSGEWQANTFATHFLLPSIEIKLDSNPTTLSMRFGLPTKYAADRIFSNWNAKKKSGEVVCTSHQCNDCGKMSIIQVGNNLVCTICPPTQFVEDSIYNSDLPSSLPASCG